MLHHLTASALLVHGALGVGILRFGCSQITVERLDPLVTPGMTPSPHVHQVVGGNAFNATIASTDVAELASCTTCTFSEDLSNYWTANVYFKARNGTYKRVPQIPNRFLTAANAGMTVYYFPEDLRSKVNAFKPGFRMLAGDPALRSAQGHIPKNCFRCFTGPNFEGDNAAPCADPKLDTPYFPKTPCPGGIRTNVHFPTCWDGKTLDTPNHKDHMAFSQGRVCPDTHPVKVPQVMLEAIWDTSKFNDKNEWPEDGSQPLVLSTGDESGFGQHADYVFGWKGDALQRAMDSASGCQAAACPTLKTQSFTVANKCVIKKTIQENTEGWLISLPGSDAPTHGTK